VHGRVQSRLLVYEKVRAAMRKIQAPVMSDEQLQAEERDLDEPWENFEIEISAPS
jgi:hypothetical protein